jgi:hypothetical protein
MQLVHFFSKTNLMIRYERVKAVQKTGESTRDLWHKTDWDKLKENPSSIGFPREDWIHQFDAERYAEENFESALKTPKVNEVKDNVLVDEAPVMAQVAG